MIFRTSTFRAARFAALALAAACGFAARPENLAAQQIQIQANPGPSLPEEDPYGVYVPTDRTLSRGVARAQERLDAGEYNEALAFLQQLLDRNEDVFLDDGADPNALRGLKAAARESIAKLPAAGREMYVLLHNADARRALDAALESGNRDQLAQIVRRYFLTAPGYEAAIILAQTELDRGHPLAAAHLYQQLLADQSIAAEFEPQLSLLAAVSWRAAGRPPAATAALRALIEKSPDAEVLLAGKKVHLPKAGDSDAELLAWLDKSVGEVKPLGGASADWLTARGDSSRNAAHAGGAPHLSPRWESRVVNDPRFENFLATRREQVEQQGLVSIPAARPIATGNVVLMRTPQNVVALDWQTGKRIWETREEESATRDQYLSEFMSDNGSDEFAAMSHPLEQRVWDDTLTMSLSSDGQCVFALGGIALASRDDQSGWQVGPGFGGPFDFSAAPTNRLTAYELATEGKLAWEIDGANAAGDLAGAFFLGTPVAVDGSLYVLAEIRSAIYLLALEPSTGALQWRQQLAGLEQGITLDPQRRLQAAMPSYSAGILVCPTTAGIVVAVDVIRREFAWIYRYPRQVEPYAAIQRGWQGRTDIAFPRSNNRWLDGSAIIGDGKVFVTPPESAELHCLDLSSGKLLWKKPRDKSLLLAGVDGNNIVLVGPDSVTALRTADGAAAWSKDFVLPAGVLPAGLGYLSEGHFFLPLSTGQVVAINTSDGTTAGAVAEPSEVGVGNLICHRGSIISQTAIFLDKFEQIEVLRERAEAALADNPQNAAAIRDLAEMRRLKGGIDEAVPMLKRAHEIDPKDLLTRNMLAEVLLEALSTDYGKYRDDLPLLRQVVDGPQQQVELLRIDARGLDASGERMQAFAGYLKLVDTTATENVPLTINPQHTARSDPWIRAQLAGLWQNADAGERKQIERQLLDRTKSWSSPPTESELRFYLVNFGGLPGTDAVRQQLIEQLLTRPEPLDTELEIMRLAETPEKQNQAAAAIDWTRWLLEQGRQEDAAETAKSVESRWLNAPAVGGKTPRQWLDHWQVELSEAGSAAFPHGRVTVEDLPAASANRPEITRRAQAEYQLGLRKLRLEQVNGPDFGPSQWLISQDGSRLIGRDADGQDGFRFNASRRSALRRFVGNGDLVQAAKLGDILYLTMGSQVVALDTRERGDDEGSDIVWQSNRAARFPSGMARTGRRNGQSIYHTWSQRRRAVGAAGGMVATLGPATTHGVVFQDQQQLRSADPLSGETLWSRSDVPSGCELFGDDEFVLAADPEEKIVYVMRMSDGELVDQHTMPETPWLLTAGRNIAQLIDKKENEQQHKILRIIDASTGKTRMEQEFDADVRMTTLEPNLLAIVQPSGKFQLIDVRTANVLIGQKLALEFEPRSITLYQAGSTIYVCVSGPARQQSSRPIGLDYPLVDGPVFAFDLNEGKPLWPGPAIIESRGIALSQPTDIPVLVFVDRVVKRDAGGSGTKLRLLCIDRNTGATVYRNDDLPDTSGSQFRIRATRGASPYVDIEMTAKTIRLKLSDQPKSPEPPANDLVEAPRKSLGRGLWGVTRRMGSVLQDVIQKTGRPGGGLELGDDAGAGGEFDDD